MELQPSEELLCFDSFNCIVDPVTAAWISRGSVQSLMVTGRPGPVNGSYGTRRLSLYTIYNIRRSDQKPAMNFNDKFNHHLDRHVIPHSSVASNRSGRVAAYAAPA
jgi:hypothetical protein